MGRTRPPQSSPWCRHWSRLFVRPLTIHVAQYQQQSECLLVSRTSRLLWCSFIAGRQEQARKKNMPSYANITLYVGAAINAYKDLWNHPERFKKILIHPGDFHYMKDVFCILGRSLVDSLLPWYHVEPALDPFSVLTNNYQQLCLHGLKRVLPLISALNKQNYARYGSLYVNSLENLEELIQAVSN